MNSKLSKLLKNKKICITVTLTTDSEIQTLNKKYLNRDYATDVLSFDIEHQTSPDEFYLGDIVVSVDSAKKQAPEYKNTIEQEISELVGHGVLHLLGVHHPHDDDEFIHHLPSSTKIVEENSTIPSFSTAPSFSTVSQNKSSTSLPKKPLGKKFKASKKLPRSKND